MKILVIIAISFVSIQLVSYLLLFIDKYGKLDTVSQISVYIEEYMCRAYDKVRLRILDPETGKHLWFVKLVSQPTHLGPTRFFMRLTQDGCSREEFEQAKNELSEAGIEFYVTTDRDPHPQAIVVHCDMDIDKAVRTARLILMNVFGLRANSRLRYGAFGGTATFNAIVGWDDSPQLDEYLRRRVSQGKPVPKRFAGRLGKQ